MPVNPPFNAASLPDHRERMIDFLDSTFFTRYGPNPSLPTPSEVRALSDPRQQTQPPPIRFEHLGLLVKFGPHVTTNEAQCLWLIKKELGDDVPVPEVYGWRIDGEEVFIYMELIRGDTLKSRWDWMSKTERKTVCEDLSKIVTSLRAMDQSPGAYFVGSLDVHHLTDYVLESFPPGGPFPDTKQFNDWFASLAWSNFPKPESILDPWRASLPDTASIKLTHGDLHRSNIMISSTSPPRVLAIVDWAHGGWYPDWWEYCKAAYTCSYDGEWRNTWIPMFLEPRVEVHGIFAEYIHAMGAV
ncbi:phosphotransferase enzyme family protein [Rhexocercosporidium sp. MPI-PUGE-AT-0058]|nr:phosphotransferase enzyme family protein [Rhexocercosporidium sp. MPI-PUGE-AT-0058]